MNRTTTQTSTKTSIISIDVSSVYLRFICIQIKKPERINCLLLRNTWLLQCLSATKTLPTTWLKNSFLHTGLLSIQKRHCIKSNIRISDFFPPASSDIKIIQDKLKVAHRASNLCGKLSLKPGTSTLNVMTLTCLPIVFSLAFMIIEKPNMKHQHWSKASQLLRISFKFWIFRWTSQSLNLIPFL